MDVDKPTGTVDAGTCARERPLRLTSCMAPNMEAMCRAIAERAGARLGIAAEFVGDMPWQERERRFAAGEIDVAWICGLPYIEYWDRRAIRLLAAPVMSAARYGGRAVYFSDLVVHRHSRFRALADLRGARFAYNEPRSHSGHNVVRHRLARMGELDGFFGAALESGAHQTSLAWIMEGRVDAAAIDSTVLELELMRRPALADQVMTIEALGPSPIPPWVVRDTLPRAMLERLQALLLQLHQDEVVRNVLGAHGVSHFVAVDDRHYDPIRSMSAEAAPVRLAPAPAGDAFAPRPLAGSPCPPI